MPFHSHLYCELLNVPLPLFNNGSMEIKFTYDKNHPCKASGSVVFSVFTGHAALTAVYS